MGGHLGASDEEKPFPASSHLSLMRAGVALDKDFYPQK